MLAESCSVSTAAIEWWVDNIVEYNDTTTGHILSPTPTSNSLESEEPRGRKRRRTLYDIDYDIPKRKRVNPPASGIDPPVSGIDPPVSGIDPPASGIDPPASGIDPPASDLPTLADDHISFPPPSTTGRDPSRQRSQSPTKVHSELSLCDPVIRHETADYRPLHPTTNSKIKKLIQYLADENKIMTEAEKASVAISSIFECGV
jgi:hypothetical protein